MHPTCLIPHLKQLVVLLKILTNHASNLSHSTPKVMGWIIEDIDQPCNHASNLSRSTPKVNSWIIEDVDQSCNHESNLSRSTP